MPKPKILVVEDVPDMRELVSLALGQKCELHMATNAREAMLLLPRIKPDLLILDVNLPDGNGFELCSRLKAESFEDIPVIFLTAKTEIEDRLTGFAVGAADYIIKPFDVRELLMRVEARLGTDASLRMRRKFADLFVDYAKQTAGYEHEGKEILLELTATEFKLLGYLLQNADAILDRDRILKFVWGDEPSVGRVVDVHISSLRRKLKNARCSIKTIYKAGYRLSQK